MMTDSTELAHAARTDVGAPTVRDSAGMLAMIAAAASNPDVDANKMVTLAKLATDLQDRERQAEFSRDKVAAISEMPSIFKSGQNTHTGTKYAKWETIHARIMPILTRHNLTLSFVIGQEGNRITVEAVLEHRNGIKLGGGPMHMPADVGKGRNDVQAVASTVAYGKRTTGKAILNLIESENPEDDDGQTGGGTGNEPKDPREVALLRDGEAASNEGPIAYQEWFKSISTEARGWMVFKGHHERFKTHAASL